MPTPAPTTETARPRRLWLWVQVGLLILVVLALLRLAALFGWHQIVSEALDLVRTAGPLIFFAAMALLPAFGFPLMPFALAAGPAFGDRLGLPWVAVLLILSVAINVSLSYWLGRRVAAPVLPWLCRKFGWEIPEPHAESTFLFMVIVRSTPGVPFWVQSYLLAAMRIPFRVYLTVSTLIPACYLTFILIFGQALHARRPIAATAAVALLLALGTVLHFIRRRIAANARSALKPTKPAS